MKRLRSLLFEYLEYVLAGDCSGIPVHLLKLPALFDTEHIWPKGEYLSQLYS